MKINWFSIFWNVGVLLILAWATISSMHQLKAAKEEIEVLRSGFTAILAMLALVGTCIMMRMEQLKDK